MKSTSSPWVLLALSLSLCKAAYDCPSIDYTGCAPNGGTCVITPAVESGYISYGGSGRWTLIPFTNVRNSYLNVVCSSRLGDVYSGKAKDCCWIEGSVGFNRPGTGGTWSTQKTGDSGQYYDFSSSSWGDSIYLIAYGVGDPDTAQYLYRPVSGTRLDCDADWFGDPWSGVSKHCYMSTPSGHDAIDALTSATWTVCALANDDCDGLSPDTVQWIRYGTPYGKYYYKLVVTTDGIVSCDNAFLEDPAGHEQKHCEYSESQYTFSGADGSWEKVVSCGGSGGCSNSQSVTVGVSESVSSEISNSWTVSLSATLSAEYGFYGVEMTTSVSATTSITVGQSMTASHSEITGVVCDADYLFQYVTGAQQTTLLQGSATAFTIRSASYWCTDRLAGPQCPPDFCNNADDCETCTGNIYAAMSGRSNVLTDGYETVAYYTPPIYVVIAFLLVSNVICCIINYCRCYNGKGKYVQVATQQSETETEVL